MEFIDINKDLDTETLENFKKSLDTPIQLQIFKTGVYDGDFEKGTERHKQEILTAIVYSKYSEMQFTMYNHKMYCMSGFKQQEGRLPNKGDSIRIIRGKYYFYKGYDFIMSEIGFEIVRGEKEKKKT